MALSGHMNLLVEHMNVRRYKVNAENHVWSQQMYSISVITKSPESTFYENCHYVDTWQHSSKIIQPNEQFELS